MATPVPDSYSAASGVVIRGGRAAPGALPAWLAAAPLYEWMVIPNTYGADGNYVDPWCGFTINQATGELLVGMAGGHNDGYDTRMSKINLLADSPAWQSPRLKESVSAAESNYGFPYCDDGVTPSSRHTRYQFLYSPQRNRVILIGSPSLYGNSVSSVESNGFDLATNTWDAPGTFPSVSLNSNYGQCIDDLGNIWARGQKWLTASNTLVALDHTSITAAYNPCCFDPVRRQLFQLTYGDGGGTSTFLGVTARVRPENNYTNTGLSNITFNPSEAWTEFQAMAPSYSALTYDKHLDKFYFYYGMGAFVSTVFVISPNAGTTWDMSKITLGAGSVTPTLPPTGGINARFQYVEALKGVVLLPKQNSSLHFMRTS